MTALYNEIDDFCADYIENLIAAGEIAPGIVDRRSIEDLTPAYLAQFTQCHFFAGIGVWSYALRQSGWPDDRPVWTGSCPCQPFSEAGKGGGFDDERHLWPAWDFLINVARPVTIFGEQVASKDGLAWIDLVSADLEGKGYTRGAVDTCAAGFGAPHWRQRLYFGADDERSVRQLAENGELGGLAHADYAKWRANRAGRNYFDRAQARWNESYRYLAERGRVGRLADASGEQRDGSRDGGQAWRPEPSDRSGVGGMGYADEPRLEGRSLNLGEYPGQRAAWPPGVTGGYWERADAVWCRPAVVGQPGYWRPVEPGSFPLGNESASTMGRLRAYGNAICAEQAIGYVESYLEEEDDAVREFVEGQT